MYCVYIYIIIYLYMLYIYTMMHVECRSMSLNRTGETDVVSPLRCSRCPHRVQKDGCQRLHVLTACGLCRSPKKTLELVGFGRGESILKGV